MNGTNNCNAWDGSETSIPNTMLLGQQAPQDILSPFTGEFFNFHFISKQNFLCLKKKKNNVYIRLHRDKSPQVPRGFFIYVTKIEKKESENVLNLRKNLQIAF